jgi:hypothetical protein
MNPRRDVFPTTSLTPADPEFPWPSALARRQYNDLLAANNEMAAHGIVRGAVDRAYSCLRFGDNHAALNWLLIAAEACRQYDLKLWRLFEDRTALYLGWWMLESEDARISLPETVEALGLDRWARLLSHLPRLGLDDLRQYKPAELQEMGRLMETYERFTREPRSRGRPRGAPKTRPSGRPSQPDERAFAAEAAPNWMTWAQEWCSDLDLESAKGQHTARSRFNYEKKRAGRLRHLQGS